jgi:hypothetical protein
MKRFILSFILLALLATNLPAVTQYWDNFGDDAKWTTVANWATSGRTTPIGSRVAATALPTTGLSYVYSPAFTVHDAACLIEAGETVTSGQLNVSHYSSSGVLEVRGTLSASTVWLGVTAADGTPGYLRVLDGGILNCASTFYIGSAASGISRGNGVLYVDGGTANIGGTLRPGTFGTTGPGYIVGFVVANSGTINCHDIELHEASLVDINEGEIWIDGDKRIKLEGYLSADLIVFKGTPAPDDIEIYYDADLDKTVIREAADDAKGKAKIVAPELNAENVAPNAILTWTPGDWATSHNIYLGTTEADVNESATAVATGVDVNYYDPAGDLTLGATYQWRVDEIDASHTFAGDIWSFTVETGQAIDPEPFDGASAADKYAPLTWTAGFYALTQDVYFGKDFEDVNNATTASDEFAGNQAAAITSYTPTELERGITYFWRVDELGASQTIKGNIWEFTVEGFGAGGAIASDAITATASEDELAAGRTATNTIDGSGLDANLLHSNVVNYMWTTGYNTGIGYTNPYEGGTVGGKVWIAYEFDKIYSLKELWVWNLNWWFNETTTYEKWGLKNVTIEYSEVGGPDANDWTTLGHYELAEGDASGPIAHGNEIDFAAVNAKYVVISTNDVQGTWDDDGSGKHGLSEVKFFKAVPFATDPIPEDGSQDVDKNSLSTLELTWAPGINAVAHDVYFGTRLDIVVGADHNSPAFMGQVATPSYPIGSEVTLVRGTTYYWRVDEIAPTTFERGPVWSFVPSNSELVDDMESYDADLNEAWAIWLDGYSLSNNGSVVNYQDGAGISYVETTIVQDGNQSLYMEYDNSSNYYSEAIASSVALPIARKDWNTDGMAALDVWVYGNASNAGDPFYVSLNDTTDDASRKFVFAGVNDVNVTLEEWQVIRIDLADFGVNLANVEKIGVGIGDPTNTTNGGTGVLLIDSIKLYTPRCIVDWDDPTITPDINRDCIVDMRDVLEICRDWLDGDYTVTATAPNNAALQGYWALESDATDSTANANDGTVTGAVFVPAAGYDGNGAVHFDGVDDDIVVPDFVYANENGEFTLTMWFKVGDLSGKTFAPIFSHADYTSLPGINVYIRGESTSDTGTIKTYFGTNEARYDGWNPDVLVNDGQWHLYSCTLSQEKVTYYIDGQITNQLDIEDTELGSFDPIGDITIGRRAAGSWYFGTAAADDGLIDDVRLYNYPLTHGEILDIASIASVYVPLESMSNLFDAEATNSKKINFNDFADIMNNWLGDYRWPQN